MREPKVGDKIKVVKNDKTFSTTLKESDLLIIENISYDPELDIFLIRFKNNPCQYNFNFFFNKGILEFVDEEMSTDTQQKIDRLFFNFAEFLKEKNKRYGDSAISPIQIFSKVDANNQICNRLDDKLNRIKNSSELKKNDIADLFGYTALLMIQKNWLTFEEMLD